MTGPSRAVARRLRPAFPVQAGMALALALSGCARTTAPPAPGTSQGTPPDLRGSRVMVLPVQEKRGVPGNLDAELAFGLQERGEGVTWILPEALDEALVTSPGMDVSLRSMPVGMFDGGEVRRVGDPLYGQLRRLSALTDADWALIPVRAAAVADADGTVAVQLWATLIHVRTGRVLWFGVVEGERAAPDDPRGLASAMDKLARTLLWYAAG